MKIELWVIGKTNEPYLEEGIAIFLNRIRHFISFSIETIPNLKKAKNLDKTTIKTKEATLVLQQIKPEDFLVLLDERGKLLTSEEWAIFLEKKMNASFKRVVFLVGGAYGVDTTIRERANFVLSLSKMTFSHQMIRLFFVEQLYRGFSILNHHPYHNP